MIDEFKKQRLQYFRKWKVGTFHNLTNPLLFPTEKLFLSLISNRAHFSKVFYPYKYKIIEHSNVDEVTKFHHSISFQIDALEQFPLRVDLSFEFAWRSLEYILNSTSTTQRNITENLDHYSENNWSTTIQRHFLNEFNALLDVIPLQATKYLVKQIFENDQVKNRLCNSNSRGGAHSRGYYVNIISIINSIQTKYGTPPYDAQTSRKIAFIFTYLLQGKEIELPNSSSLSVKYILSLNERIGILTKGIIYGFRNSKTHGELFSPFKSSLTTLQTYSLPHFCFISTNFLYLTYLRSINHFAVDTEEIIKNIKLNCIEFKAIYDKHLLK